MHQWNGNNWCYNIRYVSIKRHDYISVLVFHKHDTVCFIPVVTVTSVCNDPLYVLHIPVNDSTKESTKENMCCSGFLIARTNATTCLENGEWELETSKTQTEGDLLEYQYY